MLRNVTTVLPALTLYRETYHFYVSSLSASKAAKLDRVEISVQVLFHLFQRKLGNNGEKTFKKV